MSDYLDDIDSVLWEEEPKPIRHSLTLSEALMPDKVDFEAISITLPKINVPCTFTTEPRNSYIADYIITYNMSISTTNFILMDKHSKEIHKILESVIGSLYTLDYYSADNTYIATPKMPVYVVVVKKGVCR